MPNENAAIETETEEEIKTSEETTKDNRDPDAGSDDEAVNEITSIWDDTIVELIEQRHQVKQAEYALEDAKLVAKDAKNTLDAKQEKLNRLVDRLEDIKNGNYQPELPFPADESTTADPAKTTAIDLLDITEGQYAILFVAGINTIEDLEGAISQGKIQNIKGIGEKAVDRITDAVLKYREACPVPEPVIQDAKGNEFTTEELLDDAKKRLSP